jgi:hypothetical protein
MLHHNFWIFLCKCYITTILQFVYVNVTSSQFGICLCKCYITTILQFVYVNVTSQYFNSLICLCKCYITHSSAYFNLFIMWMLPPLHHNYFTICSCECYITTFQFVYECCIEIFQFDYVNVTSQLFYSLFM